MHSRNHCDDSSVFPWKRVEHCVIALALVLVFYVLSTGPVVRLALEEKISSEFVEILYAPFGWMDRTTIGHECLKVFTHWYGEELWGWDFPVHP